MITPRLPDLVRALKALETEHARLCKIAAKRSTAVDKATHAWRLAFEARDKKKAEINKAKMDLSVACGATTTPSSYARELARWILEREANGVGVPDEIVKVARRVLK